jgi:hypothetical protein
MGKKYANQSINRKARSRVLERRLRAGLVLDPNITRGVSYTQFERDTLGKGLLDRCGRPPRKKLDTSNEASFDEILEYGVGVA